MGDVWPQLLLVAILVLVNAAFAGTELALVSLRESQLQRLEEGSATGAVLARLARQPNQFLATIQIGITLAGFPRFRSRGGVARRAARSTAELPRRSSRPGVGHRGHADPRLLHAGVRRTRTEAHRHAARREVGHGDGSSARHPVDADQAGRVAALEVDRHRRPGARRRPRPPARGGDRRRTPRHGRHPRDLPTGTAPDHRRRLRDRRAHPRRGDGATQRRRRHRCRRHLRRGARTARRDPATHEPRSPRSATSTSRSAWCGCAA